MSIAGQIQLTSVQTARWDATTAGLPRGLRATASALRVTGDVTASRLLAAIGEVVDSNDVLRAGFARITEGPVMVLDSVRPSIQLSEPESDEQCLRMLVADRDVVTDPVTGPLIRLHIMTLAPGELVLAVVADPLVFDQRSTYLLLGAVMQAAVGRYRPNPALGLREVWPVARARQPAVSAARQAWWTERLIRWGSAPGESLQAPSVPSRTRRLRLGPQSPAAVGLTTGWTEVIGGLAWAMSAGRETGSARTIFTGGLDLREVHGLPPAMGPLTDQVVFDVDLQGLDDPRTHELTLRARASMLDAVVHHVPYGDLTALGLILGVPVPPQPARADHVVVHHCRLPPSSRHTRGDPGLARLGLSIELFGQAELVTTSSVAAAVEVHLAESGTELELIWAHDPAVVSAEQADAVLIRMQSRWDATAAPSHRGSPA